MTHQKLQITRTRLRGSFNSYIPAIILCVVSFVFYQTLIFYNPAIYWLDAHIRLALRDQLLLGHWLPLLQALIVSLSKVTLDLMLLRQVLSLLSVCSIAGMYFLARRLFSPATGLIAAAFLAFNMMFVALAIVPYPEILFVGLSLFGLALLDEPVFSRRYYFGVIALNLACLTRYEGWLFSLIFVAETGLKLLSDRNSKNAVWPIMKSGILFSLAPLAWLAFGLSGSGSIIDRLKSIVAFEVMTSTPQLQGHILTRLNLEYVKQFSSQYFHLLSWQMHPEFVMLGVIGFLFAIINSSSRLPHLRILIFLALDWLLLAFLQPWGFGNLRQPFLWQVFLTLYAAHGLGQVLRLLLHRFSILINQRSIANWTMSITVVLALILSARLAQSAFKFVAESSHHPDFMIPFQVANWLKSRLTLGDGILLLTDDVFQPYALAAYAQIPFERVLDDRFGAQFIQNSLGKIHVVYIVELYRSQAGLSQQEKNLLADLKTGNILAERISVGQTYVWIVQINELTRFP